jgi:hypothetical protein
MKQSQFYYLLRRGLFSAGSAIIKNGLVMFNKFTTAGISHPVQGSAEFNGSSDYIQLNESFSHTNHTIAAWVYVEENASFKAIFCANDSSSDGIRWALTGSEEPYYRLNAAALYYATPIPKNQWVHTAVNYDGSTMRLYIDGSLVSTQAALVTIDNSTNAVIGARADNKGDKMLGNLANVAIWNRALSSDEINSVMWKSIDSLSASESSGLQAWYSLDDISGTSVPDSSGNGNDGTAY